MAAAALGTTPIRPEAPTGDNCRFTPAFEELQGLIDETPTSESAGANRWPRVVELAESILSGESKDLLVAGYLAVGWMQTRGLPGLVDGIELCRDLSATFWNEMHPPLRRMRGRKNAVQWLWEKAESYCRDIEKPQPKETLDALEAAIDALDGDLAEKMGDDTPLARGLRDAARGIPAQAAKAPASAAPAETNAPVATPSSAPTSAPAPSAAPADLSGEVDSPQAANRLRDEAFTALRKVADFQRRETPADPAPYRIVRMTAWSTVQAPPPATDGTTQISPPEEHLRAAPKTLAASGDWAGLVRMTEGNVPRFRFWLDLSRHTWQGLDALGPAHLAARDTVAAETLAYTERMPGLEGLAFSDGTPFADGETRAWLDGLREDVGGHRGNGSAAPAGDEVEAVYDEARGLLREKKESEAVQLLETRLRGAPSGRERFLWRAALCRLLASSPGMAEASLPHLDALLEESERHGLEAWEPALAMDILSMTYRQWSRQKGDGAKARAEKALERIALISPTEAMRLRKEK